MQQLQKQTDLLSQETNLLLDKRTLASRSSEIDLSDRAQEEALLNEKVTKLESRYKALNVKVDTSLATQQKKHDMMKDLIAMDKANQALRDQIATLQAQIEKLSY